MIWHELFFLLCWLLISLTSNVIIASKKTIYFDCMLLELFHFNLFNEYLYV